MKRYWLVHDQGQYAVYDSEEKTITEWVDIENREGKIEEVIFDLRNRLERHDEEIGDIEDEYGMPIVPVIGQCD